MTLEGRLVKCRYERIRKMVVENNDYYMIDVTLHTSNSNLKGLKHCLYTKNTFT